MKNLIPVQRIERSILMLREHKVILDSELATLYGVPTKRLNEQVKRNRERFPVDFMFQLTAAEKKEVVANCDHLRHIKFSHVRPFAFTEHGALMAANVLNSPTAIRASLQIIRTFVHLREMLAAHKELARKLAALEKKYDSRFQMVFNAIRQLMPQPEEKPKRRMGFVAAS